MIGWITMLAIGMRDDVQPCVALALGLRAAGHRVRIATHAQFAPLVRGHGLEFALIEADPSAFLRSEAGRALMRGGQNPMRTFRTWARAMQPMLCPTGDQAWAACSDADVVLHTIGGQFFAPHIAEKRGIPAIGIYPYPAGQPTHAFPSVFAPLQRSLGGALNRWTHVLFDSMAWLSLRGQINVWRKQALGLPVRGASYPSELRRQGMPTCYGFSRHVLPKADDWGEHVHVTGYWFLARDDGWRPPEDLVRFLRDGPLPVYVSLGGMQAGDDGEREALMVRAVFQSEQRAVLLGERQNGARAPVYWHQGAPFDWLFQRVAAVVHNGSSGTTAAGLRAGVPTAIVPTCMDQRFWGRRVADLGVGPRPISRKRLTVEQLATAIKAAATDPEMRSRANVLGARIRAEDGVARAASVIGRYVG